MKRQFEQIGKFWRVCTLTVSILDYLCCYYCLWLLSTQLKWD